MKSITEINYKWETGKIAYMWKLNNKWFKEKNHKENEKILLR